MKGYSWTEVTKDEMLEIVRENMATIMNHKQGYEYWGRPYTNFVVAKQNRKEQKYYIRNGINRKVQVTTAMIGIGHIVRAMQAAGFGHEEVMIMRKAMVQHDFRNILFLNDAFYNEVDTEDYIKPHDQF